MNRFTMIAVACTLLLLLLAARANADNLLENGSFEERDPQHRAYPRYWDSSKGTAAPLEFVGEHRDGATAGMIIGDGQARVWRQTVNAPKQRGYTLSMFVRAENVSFAQDHEHASLSGVIVYKGKPQDSATPFTAKIEPGTYDWKRISVDGVAAGTDEIALINVSVSGKFSAGRIWVDKVELSENASLSPESLLKRKIDDLGKHLDTISDPDDSAAKAKDHLAAANGALTAGSMNLATTHWIAAARAVSHESWAKIFPESMTDKAVEARMLYHGGWGTTADEIKAGLDLMQSGGFNGTFHSLGSWASVVYPSKLIPAAAGYEKSDALQQSIAEARRRGTKSFAYLAALYGTNSPPMGPDSLYTKHPEWFATGPNPNMPRFPDPANPQVVDFIVKVYVELATNYDLDGIGLDYIRYPTATALNYDENNRRQIKSRYGIDILDGGLDVSDHQKKWAKIREYRSEKVAELVKRVRDAVKHVKPNMSLMACLFAEPDNAAEFGQDWRGFSKWLEYATPMNYDERSADALLLAKQRDIFANHKSMFIPAIGGMPEVHQAWTISQWAERVALQRRIGSDGIIIYRMDGFDPAVAAFFGNGPFHGTAKFPEPVK